MTLRCGKQPSPGSQVGQRPGAKGAPVGILNVPLWPGTSMINIRDGVLISHSMGVVYGSDLVIIFTLYPCCILLDHT